MFQQDNARPYTSKGIHSHLKVWLEGISVHVNCDEKFASREACETRLSPVFANAEEGFDESGILKLSSK